MNGIIMKKLLLTLSIVTICAPKIHGMEAEKNYITMLSPEIKVQIASTLTESNSITKIFESLSALASTNHELNELINTPWVARCITCAFKERFNLADVSITEFLQVKNYYVKLNWQCIEPFLATKQLDTIIENINDIIFSDNETLLQDTLHNPWIAQKLMQYLTTQFDVSNEEIVENLPIESIKNYIDLSKGLGSAKTTQDVKNLIAQGADVNFYDQGGSPLLWAIKKDAPIEVISAMICAGANQNFQDPIEKNTPLMLVAEQYILEPLANSLATIQFLLKMHIELDVVNIFGDTALDLVEKLSEVYAQIYNNDKKQRAEEIEKLIKKAMEQ